MVKRSLVGCAADAQIHLAGPDGLSAGVTGPTYLDGASPRTYASDIPPVRVSVDETPTGVDQECGAIAITTTGDVPAVLLRQNRLGWTANVTAFMSDAIAVTKETTSCWDRGAQQPTELVCERGAIKVTRWSRG